MNNKNSSELEAYIAKLRSNNDFTSGKLSDAQLIGMDFRGCKMEGVMLDGADLTNANMEGCDLYWGLLFEANCTNANFSNAKLNGANLKNTNFSGANLCGTDFGDDAFGRSADLEGAKFTSSIYNKFTIFPRNFDPKHEEMICRN